MGKVMPPMLASKFEEFQKELCDVVRGQDAILEVATDPNIIRRAKLIRFGYMHRARF
jgi:hypothetical protein